LPILFSFCYFSTLKVGKKHLKIEQNCSFDPVCPLNPPYRCPRGDFSNSPHW